MAHRHEVSINADCSDETDVFYLWLQADKKRAALTVPVSPAVSVDFDEAGQVLGLSLSGRARSDILREGIVAEETRDV